MFTSKSSSVKFDEFLVDEDLTSCSPSLYDNHFELTNGINIHKGNEFPSPTSSSSLSSPLPPSLTPSSSFSSESTVDSYTLMSDCADEIVKSKSQRPYNNMCNSDIKPIKYNLLNNESLGNVCINVQFHFPYPLHNNSLLTDFYDELNSDISTSTNTFTVSNILHSDNCYTTTSTIGFPPYLDKLHSVHTTSDMLIKPKSPRVLLDASNTDRCDKKIQLTQKCNSSSDSGLLYTSLPIDVRYLSTRLVKHEIQVEKPQFAPIFNTKYIYSPSLENIENKLCTGDVTKSLETDYDMSNIQTMDTNISTLSNLGDLKNQSRCRRIETSALEYEDTSITSTINVDEQMRLFPEKLIPLYESNRLNPIEYSRISRISGKYVDQAMIPNAPLTYNHKYYEDISNKTVNDRISHIDYTAYAGDMYNRTNEEIITSSCCLQRSSNLTPEHCCSLNSINETTNTNIPNPVNYYESVLCRQLYSTSIKNCSKRYEKVNASLKPLKPLNSSKLYNTIPQTLLISKMEEFVQKLATVSLIPNQLCERHEQHSSLCVEGDKQNPPVILKNDTLLFIKNQLKIDNISREKEIVITDKQSTLQKPSFTSTYYQCDTSTQTDNDDKVNEKKKFYQHRNVEHFQCPIYNKYNGIESLDTKMNSPDANHFHAIVSPVYSAFRNISSSTSACSCSTSERYKSSYMHKSTCEEAFTKCYSSYELHKHPIKTTNAKCVLCHFIDTCPGDCLHRITTCLHHGLYIFSNTPVCSTPQTDQSSKSNFGIKSNQSDIISSPGVLHFIECPKCSVNNIANNYATHSRHACYRQRREYFSTRFASSERICCACSRRKGNI
ncbi:unnamed protein product [Trichobilharzia szidati]|nr:unnamed protein product [Trichobilharzia szidati]